MTSGNITAELIQEILLRETDPKHPDAITNDPDDSGGRTQYGISEKANPEVWKDGVVTPEERQEVYFQKYIAPFKAISDGPLLHQLVDFGVTSGTETSIRTLQQLVGVAADGIIGPRTLSAVENYPSGVLFGTPVPGAVLLNLAFRDARTMFYAAVAKRRPKDLKFLLGWLRRVQEFK